MLVPFIASSVILFRPAAGQPLTQTQQDINIPTGPDNSVDPVPNDLQSFSLEFAYFPDFAGNTSHPNEFSKTLLGNLRDITGTPPVIRVGGTTQDSSEYIPSMKGGIENIFTNPDDDQPAHTNYGPGFFESYAALGDFPFIHGLNFNLSLAQETSAALEACRAIGSGHLHLYELGNEINMKPSRYRPSDYSVDDYIREWNHKTTALQEAYDEACPGSFPGFMAPSFILPYFHSDDITNWGVEEIFNRGYDKRNLTREISAHHYMETNTDDESTLPPVSVRLQNILMNHTNIVTNLAAHIQRAQNLAYLGHPYTLGETNSIARQGRNGETNVFGDALWLVDFSLWAAEHNIRRLHFHQGTDYRYGSWQPIANKGIAVATRPPYYGQVMVAKALGRSKNMRVKNLVLGEDLEAAYALFDGERLATLVVLNMQAFNSTMAEEGRPSRNYRFRVPGATAAGAGSRVKVERLTAAGSDVEDGVTFGGVSYDYNLQQGKPVVVGDTEETLDVEDGVVAVDVPDSSAVLLSF